MDTSDETRPNAATGTYGGSGYIVVWTLLIIAGMAFEFAGRFFGFEDNPSHFYHSWIPLLTGVASCMVIAAGYLVLTGRRAKSAPMRRRNGVLLLVLGGFMLLSFFAFKEVVLRLFG
ncbi:MAG: hypothetical protein LBD25_02835 [Coriobacteriales bacterium]|jgi:hypothetical protein|nr:hypothetical protein [Coriobacteriales bacterium]